MDYDKIKSGFLARTRESGDYIVLDEAGHKKKLQDYFTAEKIPSDRRDSVLLLAQGARILWVIGGRIGADVKIDSHTTDVIEIAWKTTERQEHTDEDQTDSCTFYGGADRGAHPGDR
jgi:tRNA(Ile)-lysidine synthase